MTSGSNNKPASAEQLYDLYLDACLAGGDVEAPAAFAARHGFSDEGVVAQLAALHDASARRGDRRPSRPAVPYDRLGEFRLVRPLDEGGMGMVYEAEQESLGRRVALKVVRPEFAASSKADARFQREAQAVARLKHENIVDIYAMGEDNGVRYLAMELLAGHSLEQRLRDAAARGRTIRVDRLVGWCARLARALQHAHDQGIVHRDVKPSNIHITPEDRPLLLDFGIARDTTAQQGTLTRTFAGSPLYAAPEQVMGQPIDGRADVYALGITLYRALTGRVPFEGGTLDHVIRRVLSDEPMAPRRLNPDVSRELDTVILKAIAKEPEQRYASAAAFADDLEAIVAGRSVRARPPSVLTRTMRWCRRRPAAATAIAAVLLAAAGIVIYLDADRRAEVRARKAEARDKLDDARRRLANYREQRDATKGKEAEVGKMRQMMASADFRPDWEPKLDRLEEDVDRFRRRREVVFYEVLDILRNAEALDPDLADAADDLRADLYAEKLGEARAAREYGAEEYYAGRVVEYDRSGRFKDLVGLEGEWTFDLEPADAEMYVYRYELHSHLYDGGQPRFVPVPVREGKPPIPYGTPCLRVVEGAGELEPGDLIYEVAGYPILRTFVVDQAREPVKPLDLFVRIGEQALPTTMTLRKPTKIADAVFERDGKRFTVQAPHLEAIGVTLMTIRECAERGGVQAKVVLRGRDKREMELPKGLVLRPTATPLMLPENARTQRPLVFGKGAYLLVFKKPGYETLLYTLRSQGGDRELAPIRLVSEGTTPRPFIRIAATKATREFAIMEREVTAAEYLEFLRDPAVRRRIKESDLPILFPRGANNSQYGGFWLVRDGVKATLPAPWTGDLPVLGVSWNDAMAYAAWLTGQARAAGRKVRFDLPTRQEWMRASGGSLGRKYAHGNHFRPTWVRSVRSYKFGFPEPGFRYAIDESPYGLFDCTGNAGEWLKDFEDEARTMRALVRGNWGLGTAVTFDLWGESGRQTLASGQNGFRLVMRRDE